MFFSSQPNARPLHVANLCWAFANVARADEFGAPAVAMRCARPIMFSNLPQKVIIRKSLVKKPLKKALGEWDVPVQKAALFGSGLIYLYDQKELLSQLMAVFLSMVRKYNPLKPPKGGISSGFDGEYFSA